ncbi:MAG: hypothetical protein MRY32_04450 [Rickettsiales bacterium]|nr:hypothetical protein [Rickettsiales bacterium]
MTERDYTKISAEIIQPQAGQEHDAVEQSKDVASNWPPTEMVVNLAEKAAFKFARREHEFDNAGAKDVLPKPPKGFSIA